MSESNLKLVDIEVVSHIPSHCIRVQYGELDLPVGVMPILAFHWTKFRQPPFAQSLN